VYVRKWASVKNVNNDISITAMGKYTRYKNRLEMYLASEQGRRVLNFGYSWGASIVIIGALFKILHLPMGNLMLSIGMITEFIVFIIYGFERPASEYHWENVFPGLKSDNPLDQVHFTGNIGGNGGGFANNAGSFLQGNTVSGESAPENSSEGGFATGNGGFAGGGFTGGNFVGGGIVGGFAGGGIVGGFSGSPFINSDGTVEEGNEVNPPHSGGGFVGGSGGIIGGSGFVGGGGGNSGGGTVVIGATAAGATESSGANSGATVIVNESASGNFSGTIVIGGDGNGATGSSQGSNIAGSTVVIGGGGVIGSGGGGSVGNGTGGVGSGGGGIVGGGTIIGNGETIDLSGLAALEVTEEDAQTLSGSIRKLNDAADQISKMGELTEVTEKYVEQLSAISGNMERFGQAICSLTELSDTLLNSYQHITDNSDGITQHSRNYVQQMESLNRNISGLNTIYEIQLKSISSQIETIEHINSGLIRIREMYDGSVVDSSVFHNETEKMTRQLTELNKVYTRLLQALTTNVNPAAPVSSFNY
jgi:uncharacterized protein YukE